MITLLTDVKQLNIKILYKTQRITIYNIQIKCIH